MKFTFRLFVSLLTNFVPNSSFGVLYNLTRIQGIKDLVISLNRRELYISSLRTLLEYKEKVRVKVHNVDPIDLALALYRDQ